MRKNRKSNTGNVPFWLSARMLITVMGFFKVANMMFLRLNMSTAVVCMINHTASRMGTNDSLATRAVTPLDPSAPSTGEENSGNSKPLPLNNTNVTIGDGDGDNRESGCRSVSEEVLKDGPFTWSPEMVSFVLGSYFWGYAVFQLPAGWFVGRYDTKKVIGGTVILSSLLCLITPVVAYQHIAGVIVVRTVTGILGSVTNPALIHMISHWSPPSERAFHVAIATAGYPFGALISFTVSGLLCDYGFAGGWPSIFYVFGAFGILFSIAFMVIVLEKPERGRRISTVEVEFLEEELHGNHVNRKTLKVPWMSMLTSLPFIAICVSAMSHDFLGIVMYLYIPTFLSDALHLQIATSGIFASVPYITQFVFNYICGWTADLIKKKSRLSIGVIRRIFDAVGKLVPAVGLIAIGYFDCTQATLVIVLLTIIITALSATNVGFFMNGLDIAPVHAGLLMSISNTLASLMGFVSPPLVGIIISGESSRETWQYVFLMTAGVMIGGSLFFTIFASGEVQSWAIPSLNEEIKVVTSGTNGKMASNLDSKNDETGLPGSRDPDGCHCDIEESVEEERWKSSPLIAAKGKRWAPEEEKEMIEHHRRL